MDVGLGKESFYVVLNFHLFVSIVALGVFIYEIVVTFGRLT